MVTQTVLFVQRIGQFGGTFHAACICCDDTSPIEWAWRGVQRGVVLEHGTFVTFRPALNDQTDHHRQPANVYAPAFRDDDFAPSDRLVLHVVQNRTYIILDDVPWDLPVPFFISTTGISTPTRLRVEVELENVDVHSLPEAREHDERMRANVRDRWDVMLVPTRDDGVLPLPLDLWLPTTFAQEGHEASGVYSVAKWQSERRALIDVACSDKLVSIDSGTMLRRRFRSSLGHVFATNIGTVVGVVD